MNRPSPLGGRGYGVNKMVADPNALRAGLASVSKNEALVSLALANLLQTLDDPRQVDTRPMLVKLIETQAWDLLFDSFYQVMPFGTGGRRGPVGLGPNRINPHTITLSVQGHVDYLKAQFPGTDLKVVVAFDVRHYRDLRGLYPTDVPNPLLGLTSQDLARMGAEVYAANGVKVHIWDPRGDIFPSTPELSFAIRQLSAHGGLNVSASHNHPDDNGGKFYNERGGQEIPPYDERMVTSVEAVEEVKRGDFDAAMAAGQIHLIGPEMREKYIDLNLSLMRNPKGPKTKVVFTNLHGVGDGTTGALLESAGFNVHYVPSQRPHDGAFPGVPFRAPNPEIPASMGKATELADTIDAGLVLSCDPDADRIGAMVKTQGGDWRFMKGNELSCITAAYLLEGGGKDKILVRTEVTTGLYDLIAEGSGATVVNHLMVGCKYIAKVIEDLEARGELDRYLMGTEESHGFLLTPEIRDKDGGGVGLLLAELHAREAAEGRTLLDYLETQFKRFGYVLNDQASLVMRGAVGRQRILDIQESLRSTPPKSIGGYKVVEFLDRQDPKGILGPIVSHTDSASRNVLVFHLQGGHRLIIRPSGTEPKTKLYVEVRGQSLGDSAGAAELKAAQETCRALRDTLVADFVAQALGRIGMDLPKAALSINSLVEVTDRVDFINTVLPALRAKVKAGEEDGAIHTWLKGRVASYGSDALDLVRGGFEAWLTTIPTAEHEALRRVYC